MEFSVCSSFKKIAFEWGRLYEMMEDPSPFLSPSAFKIAYHYFYPYYISRRCYPVFGIFMQKRGGKIRAIIPLLKYHDSYRIFGEFNGFNESGMLYDTPDILPECLKMLQERVGKQIEFLKIDERSPLVTLYNENRPNSFTNNVSVYFRDDFELYFKELSPSVRQNIRTAYNRITKDGHSLSVHIYNKIPKRQFNSIINLYINRHEERYDLHISRFKRWFLKHQSFASRYYRFAENALTVMLSIDNEPAAFLSGLLNRHRMIVPRLSINNQFRRYSPGMILSCETIRYLIANTSVRVFDLSRGEEDYKFKLGGQLHRSYNFTL